ncbi:MAG: hypothetical protein AAFR36_30735, partial [Bacteroidota bacterium]
MVRKLVNRLVSLYPAANPSAEPNSSYCLPCIGPNDDKPDTGDTTEAPYAFHVDMDARLVLNDSGSNRIVCNDKSLFVKGSFRATQSRIKGIHSNPAVSEGVGSMEFRFDADDGFVETFLHTNVHYVPTCPFILLPPQLWVRQLRSADRRAYTTMDDEVLCYTWSDSKGKMHTKRIPIGRNDLFVHQDESNSGFRDFFGFAQSFVKADCPFAFFSFDGADVVPSDDNDANDGAANNETNSVPDNNDDDNNAPKLPFANTSPTNASTVPPTIIEAEDSDFATNLDSKPRSADFSVSEGERDTFASPIDPHLQRKK